VTAPRDEARARVATTSTSSPTEDERRPSGAPTGTLGVQYLGHATVLLDLPGLRVITDPFLRDRLGPLRRHGPTPSPEAIGSVDLVLISHAHPDHFDRRSLRSLAGDPLVIVPRGLGALVRRAGLRAREVGVGERVDVAPRWSVLPVAARHWRWPRAPQAATIGYVVEGADCPGIYFAGDTAKFAEMRDFADRVDLALLPVGSWGPHLTPGHLGPKSAAEVAQMLEARYAIPIHWGTLYPPGLDAIASGRLREPANRFAAWAKRIAPELDVRVLQPGEATRIAE
jgi:L-ascorbate metabolism protein UlaG (beta-lactamase superfamily)